MTVGSVAVLKDELLMYTDDDRAWKAESSKPWRRAMGEGVNFELSENCRKIFLFVSKFLSI